MRAESSARGGGGFCLPRGGRRDLFPCTGERSPRAIFLCSCKEIWKRNTPRENPFDGFSLWNPFPQPTKGLRPFGNPVGLRQRKVVRCELPSVWDQTFPAPFLSRGANAPSEERFLRKPLRVFLKQLSFPHFFGRRQRNGACGAKPSHTASGMIPRCGNQSTDCHVASLLAMTF